MKSEQTALHGQQGLSGSTTLKQQTGSKQGCSAEPDAAHFNKPLASKSTDSVGISGSSIKGTQSDPSQNPAARTAIKARQVPQAIRCQRDEPTVAWATNRAAAGVAGNQ